MATSRNSTAPCRYHLTSPLIPLVFASVVALQTRVSVVPILVSASGVAQGGYVGYHVPDNVTNSKS